jgi:L-threonylcarbamoyladenylate synthase
MDAVAPRNPDTLAEAARILRAGGLVAFPTETVYGLGADATNGEAVARIFEAKGRPRFNPLIVHVRSLEEAKAHAAFGAAAEKLARHFWPGPLTLVVPRKPGTPLSKLVSAGLDTVALRVPAHPLAQELLAATGLPLAAPSANASGRISSTSAAHVRESLGNAVDHVLDGGSTPLGLESTIIGFEGETPVLLRVGAIARQDIEDIIGSLGTHTDSKVRAPGQLASHYAPRAAMRLRAKSVSPGEALLAFGSDVPRGAAIVQNLSATSNLREAAANLFAMLHTLDASGASSIAVMPIPDQGIGEAINDRLERAAAPRERA